VRVIAAIAHNMGMDVVAEGVENADQLEWLRSIGCEYAQGFYFSRPVDFAAATGLIASSPWRADKVCASGSAVQLQMWPVRPRSARVS
jgi:EAL domain-containing protein (putative c-di-GMP-specific phosphodiesterase class I)